MPKSRLSEAVKNGTLDNPVTPPVSKPPKEEAFKPVTFFSLTNRLWIAKPGGGYLKFDGGSYTAKTKAEAEFLRENSDYAGEISVDKLNHLRYQAKNVWSHGNVDGAGPMPNRTAIFEIKG